MSYPGLKTRLDQFLGAPKQTSQERNLAQAEYNAIMDLDKRVAALETAGGQGVPPPEASLPPFDSSEPLTMHRLANQVKAITDALNA